jgi:hypothetical protein
LEEEYANAKAQREAEHDQWAEYDAEYTDSIDAVNEAMDLIATLKTGDATSSRLSWSPSKPAFPRLLRALALCTPQ